MCEALTDDQRELGHLALEGETALAELPIDFLPLLSFRTAGLQRPSLARGGIVLGIDQRMNMVVHPRERMLQPSVMLLQPLFTRNLRRIPEELRQA